VIIHAEGSSVLAGSQLRDAWGGLCEAGLASREAVTATFYFGKGAVRQRSSVVPVTYTDSFGAKVDLYLKLRSDSDGFHSFQQWSTFGSELRDHLVPHSISVPLPVYVGEDPPSLLMTKVPGAPIGHAARHSLLRPGRRRLFGICEKVGAFVYALEQVTATQSENLESCLIGRTRLEALALADILGDELLGSTMARFDELEALNAENVLYPHVLAHGDLNSENIRISAGTVGFIDLGWRLKPAGYDLAFWFSHLRSQLFATPSILRGAVQATLQGYGDVQVVQTPGYLASNLRLAVRALAAMARKRTTPISRAQRQVQLGYMQREVVGEP
jgi:hypothetical protein